MAELEYNSIRVSTLRGDLKIPFDVYVYVAGKHILYCRAGESFEGKRLDRLRAKKIKKMFIRPEDQIPYDQYLEQSIDAAYDMKTRKSLEIRAEVIQGFQQAVSEEFMENLENESAYQHLRSSAQRFIEFITGQPGAALPILRLENTEMSITHHCVNVATLTTLMAMNSEFKDSTKLHLLGLGCMLHDIEHFALGLEPSKPIEALSAEELAVYKEHPLRGAARLQTASFMDQIVMNVILQHEEHMDGSGFPKGLNGKEIEPLVMMAATANAYDRLVSFQKMAPKDAQKNLMIDKLGLFPLEHIKNLSVVLKSLKTV